MVSAEDETTQSVHVRASKWPLPLGRAEKTLYTALIWAKFVYVSNSAKHFPPSCILIATAAAAAQFIADPKASCWTVEALSISLSPSPQDCPGQ